MLTVTNKFKSEEEFLKAYKPDSFAKPNVAIDTVIFSIRQGQLYVLTVKRSNYPFKDQWSLVGGYVDLEHDKNLEDTAKRKLMEKTGIEAPYLEQFETIGNHTRDPRGWAVTVVYFALIDSSTIELKPGKSAHEIKWSLVQEGQIADKLAFDHDEILKRCTERLRNKVLYTTLPAYLMPNEFTLGDLQNVYETILNKKIDHKSFRRRILGADILEETGETRHSAKKPAKLYRLKDSHTHFFQRTIEAAN